MVIQARPVPVGPTRGDFCVKRKMSLGPVSSRRGRCTSHPAEVYLGGVWSGSRALWAKLMSTTSTTSPVRISNWPLPSHFFSAKMEKSTEISSRGKKKEGARQISTGLVVLVVDIDLACFRFVVIPVIC